VLYEFLGFAGLPEVVGIAGLAAFVIGVGMVGVGEGIAGVFEAPAWAFGHVLSYLRMVAVLLAKGGMAFVVNLLVFGGYTHPETGYTLFGLPGTGVTAYEAEFAGLIWIGADSGSLLVLVVALIAAVVVFVLGHVLVLLLGITAAGIQMIRLEYVEFFQKFYEGGGEEYDPFGYDRTHTAE
jgi:V/A-type H+-transporting ATPase subunit I